MMANSSTDQPNGQFISIPHSVMRSEGYRGLSGSAVKALNALAFQFDGDNNGNLVATYSLMSKQHGFNSTDTLARSLKELLSAGLITKTRESRGGRCALYAVTWLPINECLGTLQNPVGKKVTLKELLLRQEK